MARVQFRKSKTRSGTATAAMAADFIWGCAARSTNAATQSRSEIRTSLAGLVDLRNDRYQPFESTTRSASIYPRANNKPVKGMRRGRA